ncbi:hypothetical protein L1987_64216 [Smallanthus sonchifolius]|uniref:Uncharacterized protein n=1 Tax=Smallanthus sonchifolius TaxID=185202 RepID=A0ACB9CFT7_9ASTR|nr:hypothetical protein L1987_64216 [Smallanthus sonchifolius]
MVAELSLMNCCLYSAGSTIQLWTSLLLVLAVGIFISIVHLHGFHSMKLRPKSVPEPSLEIKKGMEVDQENVLEPDPEIKKVTEIDPGIVPEHILGMNKVILGSTPKPSKKTKKVDAETTPGKK